jgi:hypothetical protein
MPRSKTNGREAMICDRVALALLLTTVVVGVGFGGTGTLAVRTTVTALALASCGAIGLSCLCEGRWRFVGGSLWLLPIAVAGWAAVQFALPSSANKLILPNGDEAASNSASWNSLATIQYAAWGVGLFIAMFAAAHAVRSASRMRTFAAAVGCTLLLVAGVGMLQVARNDQRFLGMYSAEDARMSAWGRDWVSNESSFGVRSSSPWRRWEVGADSDADSSLRHRETWLEPVPRTAGFGTYFTATDWAAAAGMLAPLLLAAGACYLRRLKGAASIAWEVDAPQGLAFTLVAALLIAAAVVVGEPTVGAAGFLFSLIVLVTMAPRVDRPVLRKFGFVGLLLALGAGAASAALNGGVNGIVQSWKLWLADSTALGHVFMNHWQVGAGFGSIGEVWPMYRQETLEVAPRGSALMSMIAESGAPVAAVAVVLLFIGMLRWRKVAPTLPPDARLMSAGVGAAIAAWLAHAALGPGGDAPSVVLLAAMLLGLAVRAQAGAIRLPEGAWPK